MKVLLMLITLFTALSTFGGERDTHGGGYFDCPNSSNDESFNLLDLWEGQKLKGFQYPVYEGNALVQLRYLLKKFKNELTSPFSSKIEKNINKILINKRYITATDNISISPPRDALNSLSKRNCKLKGVASFQSALHSFGFLYIDKTAYDKLSEFEKAVLLIHEAVYKIIRDEVGVKDSTFARAVTASICSLNGYKRFFSTRTLICTDKFGENSFYAMKTLDNLTRVHLINGYSQAVHPETTLILGMTLSNFIKEKPPFEFPLTGRPFGTTIRFKYIDYGEDRWKGYNVDTARDFEPIKCKERL